MISVVGYYVGETAGKAPGNDDGRARSVGPYPAYGSGPGDEGLVESAAVLYSSDDPTVEAPSVDECAAGVAATAGDGDGDVPGTVAWALEVDDAAL